MNAADLAWLHAFRAPAAELCRDLPLGADALALLPPDEVVPGAYLERMWHSRLYSDAALFLAHGLTSSDAIWWGHVCAIVIQDASPDPALGPVLDLIGDWTLRPSPEFEQEAAELARELEMKPPAAWVALAVSLSRAPDPSLAERYRLGLSTAIAAAVQMAASIGPMRGPGSFCGNLAYFLERGFDIARGGDGGVDRLDPPMFPGERRFARVPRPWLEEG